MDHQRSPSNTSEASSSFSTLNTLVGDTNLLKPFCWKYHFLLKTLQLNSNPPQDKNLNFLIWHLISSTLCSLLASILTSHTSSTQILFSSYRDLLIVPQIRHILRANTCTIQRASGTETMWTVSPGTGPWLSLFPHPWWYLCPRYSLVRMLSPSLCQDPTQVLPAPWTPHQLPYPQIRTPSP